MKTLFTLLLAVLLCSIGHSQNTWTTIAPIPDSLFGATAFTLNNEGYVVGGYENGNSTNKIWKYNPISNQWTQVLPSYPGGGRYKLVSFVINNIAYVGTGYDHVTNTVHNDFWKYDPGTGQWYSIASLPDSARMSCTSFVVNGKGYVFGGDFHNNLFTNDLFEYDPVTNVWTSKASLPSNIRRTNSMSFSSNTTNSGYVIGGDYGNLANPSRTRETWQYIPAQNAWSPCAIYPDSVGGPVSFSINGCHFAGLGAWSSNMWQYNEPNGGSWTNIANYPTAGLGSPTAFTIGSNAYVGTGLFQNSISNAGMFKYTPPSGCITTDVSLEHPANDPIQIINDQIQISLISDGGQVLLTDVLGRVLLKQQLLAGSNTIPIPQLQGIIMCTVINQQNNIVGQRKLLALRP